MSKLAGNGCDVTIPTTERVSLSEIERRLITKYRRSLWSKFIQAIKEYELINEGDRVAVAISGGKDSLVLAKLIQELERHGPVKFEAKFISMDPGYLTEIKELHLDNCEYLQIPLTFFESRIFDIVDNIAADYPCYMCAKMRRGALYSKAQELGCNKLALGHHLDDVIETTMLNLLLAGCFKTMLPKLKSQNFEGLELIRPLYHVREEHIEDFVKDCGLTPLNCACIVSAGKTANKRYDIKNLIKNLSQDYQQVEKSIFSAAKNIQLDCVLGWKKDGKVHSFLDDY